MIYIIATQEHIAVEAKNEQEAEDRALGTPRKYWSKNEFTIEESCDQQEIEYASKYLPPNFNWTEGKGE
jgi:hypothetical protein